MDDKDSRPPLLRMQGISKAFPGVQTLSNVDFDVAPGEVHALMGENGTGKSTLTKVLTGVHRRDAGRIELANREISPRAPREAEAVGISTVYQEVNLIPQLSVAETRVGTLSGGNQQKVLLAGWLAMNPKLIILDEPTRGIDVGAKAEIEALIGSLREEGMVIVFISSELEEVVRTCQRVAVMRDRRKLGELSGDKIQEKAIMEVIAQLLDLHDDLSDYLLC